MCTQKLFITSQGHSSTLGYREKKMPRSCKSCLLCANCYEPYIILCIVYIQARRPKNMRFFLASICHAITEPPGHENPAMGFFWGVGQDSIVGLLKKLFFDKVRTQKPGKSLLSVLAHDRKSTGRGRISREGALDHRESRERRDKIFAAKT